MTDNDTAAGDEHQDSTRAAQPTTAPRQMRGLLEPDVLGQFIEPAKREHYAVRFSDLMGSSGLADRPIERVSFAQIASAALRQRPLRLWLPGLDDSQFSIPAAFLMPYWGVWRRIAFAWIFVAGWLLVALADVLLAGAAGVSLLMLAFIPVMLVFGVLGNSLLLYQMVREVRAGDIRRDPTSTVGVVAALSLVLAAGIGSAVYQDRASARDCASKDARDLVMQIARQHYAPLINAKALERIELDTIRQREFAGGQQHCVANITLRSPEGAVLAEAHPIAYTLELTSDRRLYGTVNGLP